MQLIDCDVDEHPQDQFEGKTRWSSVDAASRDDGAYYTFQEWLAFCKGDETFAQDLWGHAVSRNQDQDNKHGKYLRQAFASDVSELAIASPKDLMAGPTMESTL